MKIYKLAWDGVKQTLIRHKDPEVQKQLDRRREQEQIGKALLYLKTLAQTIRDFEHYIGHDAMSHITDLYAMFKRVQQQMGFLHALGSGSNQIRVAEDFNPEEIKMGIEVEKEHADVLATLKKAFAEKKLDFPMADEEFFTRIAKAHLREMKDYYTKLKKMESGS